MKLWNRRLDHYPAPAARRAQLALVVLITVALYYALYVGGGVAPLAMRELHMSFGYLVGSLALANAVGAFASLLAGLSDRFGRANLVVYGLALVAVLIAFAVPAVHSRLAYAALSVVIGFVEGIILVATPALIRDFSPQVGRATAMGFWTVGPVLGSLLTSAVNSATLPSHPDWRSQFVYCGIFCLLVWVAAVFALRELTPGLRDQVMVSDRDRALVERRALVSHADMPVLNPWRQVLRADLLGSALGVSLLLLVYYTTVAFGVIYLSTVFGLSPARANGVLNWCWAANALALVAAGIWSDALRVRKPFMLAGGLGSMLLIFVFMGSAAGAGSHPSILALSAVGAAISMLMGGAYATWMAAFTEAIEARNPALTATGLAVWGWLLRLVVTAAFLTLPYVVTTVTPLVQAGPLLEAAAHLRATGAAIPPDLAAGLDRVAAAAVATAGQWQGWYRLCGLGALAFVALVFAMRGRWSPARARADQAAHDREVVLELGGRA